MLVRNGFQEQSALFRGLRAEFVEGGIRGAHRRIRVRGGCLVKRRREGLARGVDWWQ